MVLRLGRFVQIHRDVKFVIVWLKGMTFNENVINCHGDSTCFAWWWFFFGHQETELYGCGLLKVGWLLSLLFWRVQESGVLPWINIILYSIKFSVEFLPINLPFVNNERVNYILSVGIWVYVYQRCCRCFLVGSFISWYAYGSKDLYKMDLFSFLGCFVCFFLNEIGDIG